MFTLADCKDQVLSLFDEFSVDGQLIGKDENSDYLLRVPQLANKVQIEIAKLMKIPAVYRLTQNHIVNQLGNIFGFDLVQYHPKLYPIGYTLTGQATKAYYFEVDNISTITIKEDGNVIKTINHTSKGEFTAYKGNLVTNGGIVTVTFSGIYVYNIRNTALFDVPFPTDIDVPDYKPYLYYDMPKDFMELDKIIMEGNERVYRDTKGYFWENKSRLRLGYYETGSFDVHYFKYPTKIDKTTLDTYEFEVFEEAAQLIPFKVASIIIQSEKADISARLLQIYEGDLSRLLDKQTVEPQEIQSIYSI